MKNLILITLCTFLFVSQSFAYYDRSASEKGSKLKYRGEEYLITALGQTELSPEVITHIVVVGTAMKEDSDQFFQTGLLQAYKYKEDFPNRQVVIISSPEVLKTDNEEVFAKFGLTILKQLDERLNVYNLVKEMLFFKKIASFDFFGHSSPWALKLGKKEATLEPSGHAGTLKKLNNNFIEMAYATLNGCNGGFNIAPKLSKVWKIPVSGSLTSTQFERLQTTGWYKKSDRTKSDYVSVNDQTFKSPLDCKTGVCWRLKTARKNYSSYWGQFKEGGLSFPKFFCNFEDTNKRCQKAMALYLVSFPSIKPISLNSTLDDFKTVLFDYLCSTAKDPSYLKKCIEGIKQAVSINSLVFQAHPGNALHCDFKSCHASIACKKKLFGRGIRGGSCKVVTEINTNPTTLVREYLAFLEGWKLLH